MKIENLLIVLLFKKCLKMVKGSPNPHKGTCPWLLIVTQRVADGCKEPKALHTKRKS